MHSYLSCVQPQKLVTQSPCQLHWGSMVESKHAYQLHHATDVTERLGLSWFNEKIPSRTLRRNLRAPSRDKLILISSSTSLTATQRGHATLQPLNLLGTASHQQRAAALSIGPTPLYSECWEVVPARPWKTNHCDCLVFSWNVSIKCEPNMVSPVSS